MFNLNAILAKHKHRQNYSAKESSFIIRAAVHKFRQSTVYSTLLSKRKEVCKKSIQYTCENAENDGWFLSHKM